MKPLFILLLCIPATLLAQNGIVNPDYITVGKTKVEFIEWAKSVNKYSSADFKFNNESDTTKVRSWDYYYTSTDGKFSGSLENKVQYRYIFKSDTCKWVDISPGTFTDIEKNLLKNHKRVSDDTYLSKDNRYRIIVDLKKNKIRASLNPSAPSQ